MTNIMKIRHMPVQQLSGCRVLLLIQALIDDNLWRSENCHSHEMNASASGAKASVSQLCLGAGLEGTYQNSKALVGKWESRPRSSRHASASSPSLSCSEWTIVGGNVETPACIRPLFSFAPVDYKDDTMYLDGLVEELPQVPQNSQNCQTQGPASESIASWLRSRELPTRRRRRIGLAPQFPLQGLQAALQG